MLRARVFRGFCVSDARTSKALRVCPVGYGPDTLRFALDHVTYQLNDIDVKMHIIIATHINESIANKTFMIGHF